MQQDNNKVWVLSEKEVILLNREVKRKMYLSELIEEVRKSNILEEAKAELIEILEIGLEDPLSQEIEKGRNKK